MNGLVLLGKKLGEPLRLPAARDCLWETGDSPGTVEDENEASVSRDLSARMMVAENQQKELCVTHDHHRALWQIDRAGRGPQDGGFLNKAFQEATVGMDSDG